MQHCDILLAGIGVAVTPRVLWKKTRNSYPGTRYTGTGYLNSTLTGSDKF